MSRILIVGGSGFIGSDLAKYFVSRDYEVLILDRVPPSTKVPSDLKVFIGSMGDREVLEKIGYVDYVVHSAWDFTEDPLTSIRENVLGTASLLEWCKRISVKHIVFLSSTVVYGEPVSELVKEDHPLLIERSRNRLHALTKLIVEKMISYYYHEYGIPYTIFRIWWSFNDERIPGRTYRELLQKIKRCETIELLRGSGGSIVYNDDLAKAVEKSINTSSSIGEIFNIASFFIEWSSIVEYIIKKTNSCAQIKFVESWRGPGFLEGRWFLDVSKLRQKLGLYFNEESARNKFFEVSLKMLEKL